MKIYRAIYHATPEELEEEIGKVYPIISVDVAYYNTGFYIDTYPFYKSCKDISIFKLNFFPYNRNVSVLECHTTEQNEIQVIRVLPDTELQTIFQKYLDELIFKYDDKGNLIG